ncbi:serine hydrolase domain-containing protein [Halobacteriovorax sp.]|uniref:serine hydrolase domain-containing protein n=1 Tax=Halobacteriovorax sp. TaxID=2020862 RepID=UPI00356A63A1
MLSLLLAYTPSALASSNSSEKVRERIQKIVSYFNNKKSFNGNVEVRKDDDIIYSESTGIANDSFDVPHTMKSRFMIASLSKQFTAAAILKLAEEEKISLDDPYSLYVPWRKRSINSQKEWNSFTIKELLNHTSGIVKDIEAGPYSSNEMYKPILSSVVNDMTSSNDIFIYNRSDKGSYSNFGYLLLAHLVEKVSGKYFHEYLSEAFFKPLKMNSTGQYHRMFNIKYMSEGYAITDGTGKLHKRCCLDATSFIGSHSLYSDLPDLMIWLNDIFSGDSKVLSQSSIKKMTNIQSLINPNLTYGYGFVVDEWKGHKRVWHDGMETGFLSIASVIEDLGIKIVILSNKHGADVYSETPYPHTMVDQILEVLTENLPK